ncbi:MAG: hypothetical protein VXY93_15660, partial [Pseudomonadota bacterium]|nr:hypothetical protein [Pseudomonadota bacterium]
GVVIKNSGSTVGTAGTINFGDNLSVSPISAGIVTITGSAGITTAEVRANTLSVIGISTFTGNIDANGDLDVDGHTNLDNVSVAGVVTATTFVGALTGNATGLSGNPSINLTDLDVDGHTNLDNVSIAGVVTATTFKGALEATSASFSSNIDANGDLDVDGHTNLDNVSIAGVTTMTGDRLTIESTLPEIFLKDTNNNDDFTIRNNNGAFTVRDATDGADRFIIASNGRATLANDVGVNGNL